MQRSSTITRRRTTACILVGRRDNAFGPSSTPHALTDARGYNSRKGIGVGSSAPRRQVDAVEGTAVMDSQRYLVGLSTRTNHEQNKELGTNVIMSAAAALSEALPTCTTRHVPSEAPTAP